VVSATDPQGRNLGFLDPVGYILSRQNIVTIMRFGLLTRFIDHIHTPPGTTSPYNAIADLHTTNH
jgi:hypothetical protein